MEFQLWNVKTNTVCWERKYFRSSNDRYIQAPIGEMIGNHREKGEEKKLKTVSMSMLGVKPFLLQTFCFGGMLQEERLSALPRLRMVWCSLVVKA
jgi:hypothetical protein